MESVRPDLTRAAKPVRPRNRAPAPIQITAEQIVLESRDRAAAQKPPPPKQHVVDVEELAQVRLRRRKEFEDKLRMQRSSVGGWLQYARWEEEQTEVERARSVYERALDLDYRASALWLRYAEMEMRNRFINRARNVWDRAVSLLPRVDTLWYKYTYMEEMLGNVDAARALFERWMGWEPGAQAWQSYINLELRAGEVERARALYERYLACHPSQAGYLKYARWEDRGGQKALARRVYERALTELRDGERDATLYSEFAAFEARCGEGARARTILQFGVDATGGAAASPLQAALIAYEKQHGDAAAVEGVVLAKRRAGYEAAVAASAVNYDAWFDYARLEEAEGDAGAVREVYERAVAAVPPVAEKRFWRRYVYLWINYALYEELVAGDVARTRAVYRALLKLIPHATFTFGKAWLLAAKFEVRQKDLPAARRLLGAALGTAPKESVLREYIALELALGEVDRVRKLYERYVTLWPYNVAAWTGFADFERSLGEAERARAIYELAVGQPALDMPEAAWKAYIDAEIDAGDLPAARRLYDRLLARTQHVKVWLSYAAFEASVAGDAARARDVYSRAHDAFKAAGAEGNEGRAAVLETWRGFESGIVEDVVAGGGDATAAAAALSAVTARLPRRVVRKRPVLAPDGVTQVGSEEYYDYLFPDDEVQPFSVKLLAMAAKWKAGGGNLAALLGDEPAESAGGDGEPAEPAGGGEPAEPADGAARSGMKRRERSAASVAGGDHGEDEGEGEGESGEGSRAPKAARRAGQSSWSEDGDEEDAARGREHERELEDALHGTAPGGTVPRDLYSEEDAGDAADRDG